MGVGEYMDYKTKDKIIESAIELFSERGFDVVSVDQIANKAGVNKAMVYYYFSSKNDLLLSIIRKSANEFSEIVQNLDFSAFKSVEESIKYLAEKAVEYIDTNEKIVKIFRKETLSKHPSLEISVIDTITLVNEKIVQILEKKWDKSIHLSFIDQMIIINLVLGFLDVKDRFYIHSSSYQSETDNNDFYEIKRSYVEKISKIFLFLIEEGKHEISR